MTRKQFVIGAATVVIAGVAAAGAAVGASRIVQDPASERRSEARYTDAHRADAAVTQQEAERAASAVHDGRVFDTHLENEGNGLRWEVKVDDGAQVWEVQVDAGTGSVVSDQPDE